MKPKLFPYKCCYILHLVILHTYPPMKIEQSVPKRRHIKFRRRGITQKKAYNNIKSNLRKVWHRAQSFKIYKYQIPLICSIFNQFQPREIWRHCSSDRCLLGCDTTHVRKYSYLFKNFRRILVPYFPIYTAFHQPRIVYLSSRNLS
jgi:hypothetical protein